MLVEMVQSLLSRALEGAGRRLPAGKSEEEGSLPCRTGGVSTNAKNGASLVLVCLYRRTSNICTDLKEAFESWMNLYIALLGITTTAVQ